jgi:hypothetical protein
MDKIELVTFGKNGKNLFRNGRTSIFYQEVYPAKNK